MPEVYLNIEWPDAQPDRLYSPSTVIMQYFKAGDEFSVSSFEEKVTMALQMASKRVYERFGFECTSAMAELARIRKLAAHFEDRSQKVKIIGEIK